MTQTSSQTQEPAVVPTDPYQTQTITSPENDNLNTTLGLKDSIGAALTKQGKYSDAVTLLSEVLATRESRNQSPTSPGMLCTMNNLAAALHHQGDLITAESLHRRVLEADRQTLRISHPNTITAMHNLAAVLANQGFDTDKDDAKLAEAAELSQRALQLSQQTNGSMTPQTLSLMGSHVNILLRQGKYEQAEALAREVLVLQRGVLRPRHPDVGTAMHNLRAALKHLGKGEEAEALGREMQKFEDGDGDGDGRIEGEEGAGLPGENGIVAMKEGRYEEAERIFRQGLVMGAA